MVVVEVDVATKVLFPKAKLFHKTNPGIVVLIQVMPSVEKAAPLEPIAATELTGLLKLTNDEVAESIDADTIVVPARYGTDGDAPLLYIALGIMKSPLRML